jgi:SWI/SNF-related matrix-associated actin-dependent regulator 1 of chromatin subfamily A
MTTPDYSDLFASLDAAATTAPQKAAPAPMYASDTDAILAASKAITGEATVAGMARPFLPHQAAAYNYVIGSIARRGSAFVGDDMGLGKTQVALATIAQYGRGLVIAPPVAWAGWADDCRAAFPNLRIAQIKGRKVERDAQGNVVLPDADILFISDDALTLRAWLTNGIDARKRFVLTNLVTDWCNVMVRDEIHRDKGADGRPAKPTSRARLMLTVGEALIARNVPRIGMSGTILTNRPIEALIPLQILGGKALVMDVTPGARNVVGFAYTYCNPTTNGFGTSFAGCERNKMPQLHDLLRRTVYVRREKTDVGNLPHGGWLVKPIALNGVLTRYRRIEREFLDLVREEEGPEAMWRKARAEAITRMQAMWEEAGVAKAAATVEYVADLLDDPDRNGAPVIVFYYHQAAFDALLTGFAARHISCGIINGQVTGDRRRAQINAFQAGRHQVMLAQIKAAGMAVTLTAAPDAVFHQVPWSAGDVAQAASRNLRADDISRARAAEGGNVTWHVMQAAHEDGKPTFDMAMWDVLERKAQVCDAVNAGRPITMPTESVMQAALDQWYASAS